MDDSNLMRLCMRGDRHAFRMLVQRYQKPVYNFFIRSVRSREDAEDLTQQLFIRLFSSSYKVKKNASFRTFLFRIASNLLIDFSRRQKHRKTVSIDDLADGDAGIFLQSRSVMPDRYAEGTQIRMRYAEALSSLPVEWRVIFELRMTEGMSYREIAETTGKSVSAVESVLFRARERLSALLSEFMKDGECGR